MNATLLYGGELYGEQGAGREGTYFEGYLASKYVKFLLLSGLFYSTLSLHLANPRFLYLQRL